MGNVCWRINQSKNTGAQKKHEQGDLANSTVTVATHDPASKKRNNYASPTTVRQEEQLQVLTQENGMKNGRAESSHALPVETQRLVEFMFNKDIILNTYRGMAIDTEKLRLSEITQTRLKKALRVLLKIQKIMKSGKPKETSVVRLSHRFYSVLPYAKKHPILDEKDLREKLEMISMLSDMKTALRLIETSAKAHHQSGRLNYSQINFLYNQLKCDLDLIEYESREAHVIKDYFGAGAENDDLCIRNIWRINQQNQATEKYRTSLCNRTLLWHGTTMVALTTILQSRLRIVPHSGGRVGYGIYFADQRSLSTQYVPLVVNNGKERGLILLCEVTLGKVYSLTQDDPDLLAPPAGYSSVMAVGRTQPDPEKDEEIHLDDHTITIPLGRPVVKDDVNTMFDKSEYVIYKESQCRLRYLLLIEKHVGTR